jgi:hypothetical protein
MVSAALSVSRLESNSHGATFILSLPLLSPTFIRGIATPLQSDLTFVPSVEFPNPYFAAGNTKRVILHTLSTSARPRC